MRSALDSRVGCPRPDLGARGTMSQSQAFRVAQAPDPMRAANVDPSMLEPVRRMRQVSRPPWTSLPGRYDAMPSGRVQAWGRSELGQVRPSNEDCHLVAMLDRTTGAATDATTDAPPGLLLMVADGVGGRPGGEIASAIAVVAMACYVQTVVPWVLTAGEHDRERLDAWLHDALRRTQARMRRFALRRGLDPRLATTFTMACVTWPDLVVAHVGDSRCYLARDGGLERLTVDHTLAQRLYDEGQLTPGQLDRSPYAHMLLNALGGSTDELNVDLYRTRLQSGDQLLLCSDGLTRHVRDDELAKCLADEHPVAETVDELVDLANLRGGSDNITVVLARPGEP
jgi:serine/threonine protein phosphatase PrpC